MRNNQGASVQALAVPATPANAVDGPSGFDPSRETLAVSSSACFYPEKDEPELYTGDTITWTFEAGRDAQVGAGLYRLQFVRVLTPAERAMKGGELLKAIAMEARRGETGTGSTAEGGDSAGRQASPEHTPIPEGDRP